MPTAELDVRSQPPARRHDLTLSTYDDLDRARSSCWSMTTTRNRCTTNSLPNTPTDSRGIISRAAPRSGRSGSAVQGRSDRAANPNLTDRSCRHDHQPDRNRRISFATGHQPG